MATRRITTQEKTHIDQDETKDEGKSNIAPAVPTNVIVKLLGFTFAMIIMPIGSYFLTLNSLFSGNSTYAGATAAIVANIVLIGYVIVAFKDDQSERAELEEKEKKSR
ncbi:vacuolar ATPase assembly integral membrane protein vma21 [Taxawa tesnikishii (nom. ined.)]|nr:vacuolar ATPase assembly integral membrane protein vma21 [Dothideales sp. JES 119]